MVSNVAFTHAAVCNVDSDPELEADPNTAITAFADVAFADTVEFHAASVTPVRSAPASPPAALTATPPAASAVLFAHPPMADTVL